MPVINIGPPTNHVPDPNRIPLEYPKFLHFADKPSVIVHSKEEECHVLGLPYDAPEDYAPLLTPESVNALANVVPSIPELPPIPTLTGENNEREMLLKIAEQRGFNVDRRWKTEKIRRAVEVQSEAIEQQASQ